MSGNFFKAVVQAFLMFGLETWVLTPRIERALDSFMQGDARRIAGNQPRQGRGGKSTFPPLKEAMREVGFVKTRKAVTSRQNAVTQYIATQLILDLCEQATQREGAGVSRRWWDQEWVNLRGAKERAAEALATDSDLESEVELEAEVEEGPEVGGEERSKSSGLSGSSGAEWSGENVDPWG